MNYSISAESSVSEDIDIDDYDNQFENASKSSGNSKINLNEHINLSRRYLESRIGFQSTNNYFANRTDQDEADGEEEDDDDNDDDNYVNTTYSSSKEKYNNSFAILSNFTNFKRCKYIYFLSMYAVFYYFIFYMFIK